MDLHVQRRAAVIVLAVHLGTSTDQALELSDVVLGCSANDFRVNVAGRSHCGACSFEYFHSFGVIGAERLAQGRVAPAVFAVDVDVFGDEVGHDDVVALGCKNQC